MWVANRAVHPTVSVVTPVANVRNRRAARPAGDGRRWADMKTRELLVADGSR